MEENEGEEKDRKHDLRYFVWETDLEEGELNFFFGEGGEGGGGGGGGGCFRGKKDERFFALRWIQNSLVSCEKKLDGGFSRVWGCLVGAKRRNNVER